MSDEAVKERSGNTWTEWFKILDKAGAKKWKHQEITAYLNEKRKVGPWWRQMVAVEYERARGLREMFQKCDGEFAASGSGTVNVAVGKIYRAWTDEQLRKKWLPGAEMEITTATQDKSLRAKWHGGESRLSVNFYPKGAEKAQVAVDHMKLASSKQSATMKTYWFEALNRLQTELEA